MRRLTGRKILGVLLRIVSGYSWIVLAYNIGYVVTVDHTGANILHLVADIIVALGWTVLAVVYGRTHGGDDGTAT